MEVTPEVIEQGISPISRAEQWLAGARGRVAELAAQYRVPDEIETDAAYKDAKQARSSVRKDAQELEGERKRMTREMDDALKRFRADVRDVLTPLTDLDAAYKAALDDYEARWGQERRAALQEAYGEYAPDLVPLVPLDRLVTRYGSERGKGWLNRSTNVEAAKAALRAAIDDVASGEATVAASVDPEDAEGAKADFFASLDIGAAIKRAHARAEQRERVRRLEEERRAREAEQERIEAELRAQEAARAAEEAEIGPQTNKPDQVPTTEQTAPQSGPQRLVKTGAVMSREEAAAAWAATTPNAPVPDSLRAHVALSTGEPSPGQVPPFLLVCYGSRADADAFRAWCEQRRIRATVRPTEGSVFQISRKR